MTEDQIKQEINEIKRLIRENRYKKGFYRLGVLLEEFDRLDETDTDDQDLAMQFEMIQGNFNTLHKNRAKGVPIADEKFNQMDFSILSFLDEVKKIAIEYAKPEEQKVSNTFVHSPDEVIATNIPSSTSTNPTNTNQADADVSLADGKYKLNFKSLVAILTFLTVIILGGMAMFFFADGCSKKPINPTPPIIVDTTEVKPEPEPEPIPLGLDGEALGFENGSAEDELADYLSDPKSSIPSKVFKIIEADFARSSSRLNASSRHKLDNIAKVLEEYPDAKIDIYGYMADNESASNGNKESGSLDDARAKAVYKLFKTKRYL